MQYIEGFSQRIRLENAQRLDYRNCDGFTLATDAANVACVARESFISVDVFSKQ